MRIIKKLDVLKKGIAGVRTATGLYYYGVSYYDPRMSIWLSTDPLQEKYPSITPYHYSSQNPIKFIDIDGLDDYFNENGVYLGADNSTTNFNVRITNQSQWDLNKNDDGSIDEVVGQGVGALVSSSKVGDDAIIKILEHYNPTDLKLSKDNNSPDLLMAYSCSYKQKSLKLVGEEFVANVTNLVSGKYMDNIYDIKNIYVHEDKHYKDRKSYGLAVHIARSKADKEHSAIMAQVNDHTWGRTSAKHKENIKSYANSFNLQIWGLNVQEPKLQLKVKAPMTVPNISIKSFNLQPIKKK